MALEKFIHHCTDSDYNALHVCCTAVIKPNDLHIEWVAMTSACKQRLLVYVLHVFTVILSGVVRYNIIFGPKLLEDNKSEIKGDKLKCCG